MSAARVLLACLAVLVLAPAAGAKPARMKAPTKLHGFLLRADEPAVNSFSRTPAFAWNPVAGAVKYQFQLATSTPFRENAIVYSSITTSPVAAPTVTLPWIDDMLHARVRALTPTSVTPWSTILDFDMDPPAPPAPLASVPGLLHWTPVEGATGYQVWLIDIPKMVNVYTNVLDEREFYTFHRTANWAGNVRWRIRALRQDNDPKLRKNGVPAVTYGAWSPIFNSTNPAYTGGPISPASFRTVSDVVSAPGAQLPHKLMPAFSFSGDQTLDGRSAELFRVYVCTDDECLNPVYMSPVFGGPAYAPRPYGPLNMPTSDDGITAARGAYLPDGDQLSTFSFEGLALPANNESLPQATPTTAVPEDSDTELTGDGSTPSSAPQQIQVSGDLGAPVDLWDSQAAGGDWWTVMPVEAVVPGALSTTLAFPAPAGSSVLRVLSTVGFAAGDVVSIGPLETVTVQSVSGSTLTLAGPLKNLHGSGETVARAGGAVEYRDMELLQDVMAAGRYGRIVKNSEPTLAAAGELFASGLSSKGKLISAKRTSKFYGSPLVAWTPALGADVYEVQWSKTGAPFNPQPNPQNGNARGTLTAGTAVVLPLTPGNWYYRVRGFNWSLPTGAQQMSWSNPAKIVVAKPQFRVVGGK